MKDSLHTLLYAVVLGLVCATSLTCVNRFTAERREMNEVAEEARNIMDVLGVDFDKNASARQLLEIRDASIRRKELGELTLYTYEHPSEGLLQAVKFAGPGLWGPIKGFLALDAKMETIRGVTFYQQEETPGLGGEITSPWFRRQFEGKTIRDIAGRPGIRIRRGGATAPNEVDAITGATMTCEKVEAMLNVVIRLIVRQRDKHGR